MAKIWQADVPAMDKIVLLKMADCASDDGENIYPAVGRIARECGCSERHVQNTISKYMKLGILELVSHENSSRIRARIYRIDPRTLCTPEQPAPPHLTTPTPAPHDVDPRTGCTQTIIEPSKNHQYNNDFEKFWDVVPIKVARGAAESAFKAARKKTDLKTILEGMKRYRDSVKNKDRVFISHPSTWLNKKRWLDEPEAVTQTYDIEAEMAAALKGVVQ